jgi:hypothetical protein
LFIKIIIYKFFYLINANMRKKVFFYKFSLNYKFLKIR